MKEIYNRSYKEEFYQTNGIDSAYANSLFRITFKYESKWQRDAYSFSAEEWKQVFSELGTKMSGLIKAAKFFKDYIIWAQSNGDNPNTEILEMTPKDLDSDERVRGKMVSSPAHLHNLLEEAFRPLEYETVDCILRSYIWLIYHGIRPREALDVKVSDLDFERNVISYNGASYPIFYEAIPALKAACMATSFKVYRPDRDGYTLVQRKEGERIIRTPKSERMTYDGIFRMLRQAFSDKGIKITGENIYMSGVFYSAWRNELARPSAITASNVVLNDYINSRYNSLDDANAKEKWKREKAFRTVNESVHTEYKRWKSAFNK